jgi:NADP-dependent 3-hydroxy acid dehydrogenase YdfG
VVVTRPLALVAGSGGVLGQALLAVFEQAGYAVAGLRRADCDFGNPASIRGAVDAIEARHGPVQTLLYNAAHLAVAPFLEQDPAELQVCLQAGPVGAANCARAVLPGMLAQGAGTMVFTGATASMRGSARFAAMAASKFALRGLVQSLAREFQPRGIHVAHVVVDGLLQGSTAASRFGEREASPLPPAQVAQAMRWLVEQPPAAWTHELDLRPATERF